MQPLCPAVEGGPTIAIDGKSVRGSRTGKAAMVHLVSACHTASGLTLGQVRTAAKSNEITAIPELLDALDGSRRPYRARCPRRSARTGPT